MNDKDIHSTDGQELGRNDAHIPSEAYEQMVKEFRELLEQVDIDCDDPDCPVHGAARQERRVTTIRIGRVSGAILLSFILLALVSGLWTIIGWIINLFK